MNYDFKTIHPGELYISRKPSKISTLLGSCVTVTVFNRRHRFGGMNHFMIPRQHDSSSDEKDYRFGDLSTRALFDKILRIDSDRDQLEVKLFGGGMVVDALEKAKIGKNNVRVAREIITEYGLSVSAESVENEHGLKLIFNNYTGQVWVKPIQRGEAPAKNLRTTESKIVSILRSEDGIDLLAEE